MSVKWKVRATELFASHAEKKPIPSKPEDTKTVSKIDGDCGTSYGSHTGGSGGRITCAPQIL